MYDCPCCDFLTLPYKPPGSYEVCPVCAWVDEPDQYNNPDSIEGCNVISLIQARANFKSFRAISENDVPNVRLPMACENPLYELIRRTLPHCLPDTVLIEARSLGSINPYEIGWTKESVHNVISFLGSTNIPIASIDVYKEDEDVISPAYINWSCTKFEVSNELDYASFAKQSREDALDFVDSTKLMDDTIALFVLIF